MALDAAINGATEVASAGNWQSGLPLARWLPHQGEHVGAQGALLARQNIVPRMWLTTAR